VFEFHPQQRKRPAAMAGSLALHAACITAALLAWAGSPVRVTHHVYTWLYAPLLDRPETAPPSAALSSPHHHARVAPRLWLPSPPPRRPVQLPAAPELTPAQRMSSRVLIATTPSLPPQPAAPRVVFEARSPGPRRSEPGNLNTGVFGVVSPQVETSTIFKQGAETGFNAQLPAVMGRPRTFPPLSTGMFGDSSAGPPARIRRPATTSGFDAVTPGSAMPARSAARASTGAFGDSTAIPKPVRLSASKVCAGFDPQTATVAAAAHSPSPQLSVMRTVLEILHKPRPAYTDEARKLGIEGDVVLEVWFGANGMVRVGRILRGLGHGLDEQAARSAMDILFRPATERGQPVDTRATVRIEFQLAD
jgi:TonB family protein